MGRPKRDFKPHRQYAIQQHAIAGRSIFQTDFDRQDFHRLAYKYAAIYRVKVGCLHIEHDHYHMMVETGDDGDISSMMGVMLGTYSRGYNSRHKVRKGLEDTSITKFQNFGNRYHCAEVDPADDQILRQHMTGHRHPSECRHAPELAKDATPKQRKEREIIAALILATKWNRPVRYALARLAWWEERQRRRHAWRRHLAAMNGSDPPG